MKFKTTQKYINNIYGKPLVIPYCGAQHLLSYENPIAYNAGIYGWNCDYYYINGVMLCTGYRPHGTHINYDLLKEYEDKAEKAYHTIRNYEDRKAVIKGYLAEFLKKATENA